jgi:hypothetical protein
VVAVVALEVPEALEVLEALAVKAAQHSPRASAY